MKQNSRSSLAMLIAAMGIWGTIGLFRKSIPLSFGLIAFSRGVIGAAFLSLLAKGRGGAVFQGVGRTKALWLSLSGAAALSALVLSEKMSAAGIAGSVLILSSAVFSELRGRR